jgi:hypothetical protein
VKLVLIEWVDAHSGRSMSWTDYEQMTSDHALLLHCVSVGWLLHDGEDCKVIVPHHYAMPGGEPVDRGCGQMSIPTVAVQRMVELCETVESERSGGWTRLR